MKTLYKYKVSPSRIVLVLLFLVKSFGSAGQQEALTTQYMFNGLAINPAYAGSHGTLEMVGIFRTQWVGFDGAPNTVNFGIHGPLKMDKSAIGFNFNYDVIGVTQTITMAPSYAYKIHFGDKYTLSFGVQASVMNYRARLTELEPATPGDLVFANDANRWLFNFGTGVYFYSNDFYVGFSVPMLVNNHLQKAQTANGNAINEAKLTRHYYLTGGYVFTIQDDFFLKPNVMMRYVEGSYFTTDFNLNFYYKRIFGVGFSYRTNEAISILAELFINNDFQIGYAYDYILTGLNGVTSGSHEVMLNYRFPFNREKAVSPRYF